MLHILKHILIHRPPPQNHKHHKWTYDVFFSFLHLNSSSAMQKV